MRDLLILGLSMIIRLMTIMGGAQAPVFRDGVNEPSGVLREYIQRRSKR